MLISVQSLKKVWRVQPSGVLHIGAHEAEELEAYETHGWMPITWVEAQPEKIEILKKKLPERNNFLIEAAVWDTSGVKLLLNITNNTESTSLLDLDTHLSRHPEVKVESKIEVITKKLDDLVLPTVVDYLSLDIQGSELKALQGFERGIKNINWVYTEVNKESLYKGCARVEDIDAYLKNLGFNRELTVWTKFGWGDALYVRFGILSGWNRLLGKLWINASRLRSWYFGVKHSLKIYLEKSSSEPA